ncbi:MAG: VOC family protein, partial [Pseudomonadota bacterium]
WQAAGLDVLEIDHNWCESIYTKDPNGNMVEFCLTTGAFTADDRQHALNALEAETMAFSAPPGRMEVHKAADANG